MAVPSLPCTSIVAGDQSLTITLPGGAVVSLCYPTACIPSPLQATRALLQQINTSLAPLAPILRIVDCIYAAKDIVWDPATFIAKLAQVVALVPPANCAALVATALDVVIAYMQGTYTQIQALIVQETAILDAGTKAATLGNARLQLQVDCATAQLTAQIVGMNEGMEPLNALIAILQTLLDMATGGTITIPSLASLGSDLSAMLSPLASAISAMQAIRAAIPLP